MPFRLQLCRTESVEADTGQQSPPLTRRYLLTTFASVCSLGSLPSCTSSIDYRCNDIADRLSIASCRQKYIKDTAPIYISAGMIIGAAIGAGIAVASRGSIPAGLAAGALLGGGVAAADRYLAYVREQASGNAATVSEIVLSNINTDVVLSRAAIADARVGIETGRNSVRNISGDLLKSANELERARRLLLDIKNNTAALSGAKDIYIDVCPRVNLSGNSAAQSGISNISSNVHDLERIHAEFFSMLPAG